MIRKFYINMTQKGNIRFNCAKLVTEDIVRFIKTDKKQIEVLEVDWDKLLELDKKEIREAIDNGYYIHKRRYTLERILGIDKNNPYRSIHESKEIKETDREGYIQVKYNSVEDETDKAYFIFNRWIAKSQTILEEGMLYIKDWLFFKEFC
ncbi:hypothetical protein ACEE21_14920 [Clostridium baratii]